MERQRDDHDYLRQRFPPHTPAPTVAFYQSCDPGSNCPFSSLMTLDSNFQMCTDGFDARVREEVNVAAVAHDLA